MEELRTIFSDMVAGRDTPQRRGYSLPYRRPYKLGTEQIDGHFQFEGFDYLHHALGL